MNNIILIIGVSKTYFLSMYDNGTLVAYLRFNSLAEAIDAKQAWKGFLNDNN